MSLWPPSLCQPFLEWVALKYRKLKSQLDSGWQDWLRIPKSGVEILSAAAVWTEEARVMSCISKRLLITAFVLVLSPQPTYSWWSDWLFLSYIRGSYLLFWVILAPKRARSLEAPCFSFWWLTLRQLRVWVFCCAVFLQGKLEGKEVCDYCSRGDISGDTLQIESWVLLCY